MGQAGAVAKMLGSTLPASAVSLVKDLSGVERVVMAQLH
jgi:hypothetical protein